MKTRNIYGLGVVFLLSVSFCFVLAIVGRLQTVLPTEKSEALCSATIRGLEFCADPKTFSIKAGDDVILNLVTKNVGPEETEIIGTTGLSSRYKLSVVDENGSVLLTKTETKIKYHLMTAEEEETFNAPRFVSHRASVLKPNTSMSEQVNLSKIYDFSNAGKYYLEISRKTITPEGKVTEGDLKLERIEIDVK